MAKAKYKEWLLPENLTRLRGWAMDGLTDAQIAENIGISTVTIWDWKSKYPNFANALKKGKDVADREVENALYKSAMGYDVIEEIQELRLNKETSKYEMVVVRKVKKHIPPSNTAQIFWLKNRKPHEWREKQEVEVNSESLNKAIEILGGIESGID